MIIHPKIRELYVRHKDENVPQHIVYNEDGTISRWFYNRKGRLRQDDLTYSKDDIKNWLEEGMWIKITKVDWKQHENTTRKYKPIRVGDYLNVKGLDNCYFKIIAEDTNESKWIIDLYSRGMITCPNLQINKSILKDKDFLRIEEPVFKLTIWQKLGRILLG